VIPPAAVDAKLSEPAKEEPPKKVTKSIMNFSMKKNLQAKQVAASSATTAAASQPTSSLP